MRKDGLKSGDYCPDCVETEDGNAESDNAEDCCSCCCSCNDSAAESETSSRLNSDNYRTLSLEQQKKDILSNLTISHTNREQASLHHVLQFVEALTHSSDFLRRYNLQEDFCVECLISEPVCTCCTNGMAQLNVNDQSSGSCEECQSNEDYDHQSHTRQECPVCAPLGKTLSPVRQRINDRTHRRRRRRHRNIRHSLPRVSTEALSSRPGLTNNRLQRNPLERNCSGEGELRNFSRSPQNQAEDALHGNCENCIQDRATRSKNRHGRREFSSTFCGASNENSNFCADCARENLPSSSSSFSCCGERGVNRQKIGNSSSDEEKSEYSCGCCSYSSNEASKDKPKIKKTTTPGWDQNGKDNLNSEGKKNRKSECSCEECESDSDCSYDSCEECIEKSTKKKK